MPWSTNVYIDGFNLYNGAVKDTPHKWLNLAALCKAMLPGHHVNRIRYFTAHVSARPSSPYAPINQQVYLRALSTIPNLSVHLGQFVTRERWMVRAGGDPASPEFVKVLRTDEKGTDVNLATYLLHDAYRGDFECAVIMSNDADLITPVRIVKEELGKRIGLLNPHEHPTKQLKQYATFYKPIRLAVLGACQFPPVMSDVHGTITKPSSW